MLTAGCLARRSRRLEGIPAPGSSAPATRGGVARSVLETPRRPRPAPWQSDRLSTYVTTFPSRVFTPSSIDARWAANWAHILSPLSRHCGICIAETVETHERGGDVIIAGKSVLVTGANRGIGHALVEEALRRGATRVYAGTRRIGSHPDRRVTPVALCGDAPRRGRAGARRAGGAV